MDYLPSDEQSFIKLVAGFYNIRYVGPNDRKQYIIDQISKDFDAMPGWDIWDKSVHESYGQYDRMERAVLHHIQILHYDSTYRLAKVQGKTSIYVTSCQRCSCPDYRKRRLPCKHMYALAIELDGDIEKDIVNCDHAPLHGLSLALAGHFPRKNESGLSIREQIELRGGSWTSGILPDSSVAVFGATPSERRVELAQKYDIEILDFDTVSSIFQPIDSVPSE